MNHRIGNGIKVCIVEHDQTQRAEMVMALDSLGFGARGFGCSHELFFGLLQTPSDAIILGSSPPHEKSLDTVRQLRNIRNIGVVVLSAQPDTDERIRFLTDGADIHLVKPVDPRELAASLVSLYRRLPGGENVSFRTEWRLEGDDWVLVSPRKQRIPLTASERTLLQVLFLHPNTAVQRDDIITALGHGTDYYLRHRLDMLVSRLRRKVLELTGITLPLKSVRGIGLMLSLGVR